MAQADSKNSTVAPVVPTRRHFLSQAAGVAAGGTVLALATIPPAAAITAPAAAVALPQEDPAIIALGERIEPLLAAYRSSAADRLKARANAAAPCPAVPDEIIVHFTSGIGRSECDVEGLEIWPSGLNEHGVRDLPRQILDSEKTKAAIARGNLYCNRRTKSGKKLAKQIEIAERYEKEREAAIDRSGLLGAASREWKAAYEIEKLAGEAAEIEPRTMAGAIIQARALASYAEVEIVMRHYHGRAGQVVGLALARSMTRLSTATV